MAATLLSALALGLFLVGPSLVFAQSDEGSDTGELNTAFVGSAQDDEATDDDQGSDDLPGSIVGSGGTGGDGDDTETSTTSDDTTASDDVTSMPSTGIGTAVSTSIGLTSIVLALFAVAATMAGATSFLHARRS